MGSDRSAEGKSEWKLSQPRPLTLLIACGVVLAVALVVVTSLVAGYLREQTLESSEAGLLRLEAVLVAAGNRSLLGVKSVLSDISSHVRLADVPRPDAIASEIGEAAVGAHLDRVVEAAPQIAGIALVGADGAMISHTGGWPSGETNVATRDYFVALQEQCGARSLDRRAARARKWRRRRHPGGAQAARHSAAVSSDSRSPRCRSAISKASTAPFRWARTGLFR